MNALNKREPLILLLGDIFFFLVSLWVTLTLRNFQIPSDSFFLSHLTPFGLLFVVWLMVFYIAGLYDKNELILGTNLPNTIFNTQIANSLVAVLFFYFIPFFGITPKTILFIYLIVSFFVILGWRAYGYFLIGPRTSRSAFLIGSGSDMKELQTEVNSNPLYNLRFISSIDLNRTDSMVAWDEIVKRVYTDNVSVIAIDLSNEKAEPVLPHLYNLIFSRVRFIDMHKVYEDVFDRVPLSLLKYNWFLENISTHPRATYDALKRIMDVVISAILLVITIPLYPFIISAIKLNSPGSAFISQSRFGKNNKIIKLVKFRSMLGNDAGKWPTENDDRVTKVGKFLRRSRLDELPQLWNVFLGDISLIGPRPDIYDLGVKLQSEIPYYNIRNIIKPGLSGWAQIKQDIVPHSVEETKARLAYDLYYIKNRSLLLDLKIALRTIKTLLSRVGK